MRFQLLFIASLTVFVTALSACSKFELARALKQQQASAQPAPTKTTSTTSTTAPTAPTTNTSDAQVLEKDKVDASRISMKILNADAVEKLNSTQTTESVAVEGQIMTKEQAEPALTKGATACGLTYKNVKIQANQTFTATDLDSGKIEGSKDTQQVVIRAEDGDKGFAVFCAKLSKPVTLVEAQKALTGIIEINVK